VADLETSETVKLAMRAMSVRQRMVMTATLAGWRTRTICAWLGISEQMVWQDRHRAVIAGRHALRKEAVRVGSTLDECWR